ncbi:MAG: DMT family transporter [Balneolales bacterium]|nr:DMT family transporter [Balneolales bacterium]
MASPGIIFILLSVSCSVLLANFLKLGESRSYSTINVLTWNYATAVAVAFFINIAGNITLLAAYNLWFWVFCLLTGTLFIANFFIFSRSVHANGVGVSIASMRMSLLLPVLLSIFLYQDTLGPMRVAGILLVFAALGLILWAREDISFTRISGASLLILLFLGSGMADASLKVYEEEFSGIATEAQMLSFIFLTALIIGIISAVKSGSLFKMKPAEAGLGVAIGIPNLLSSYFLIQAFRYFDASVVYSTVNVLVVVTGTITGIIFWKDRPALKEISGIMLAVAAIYILTFLT